LLGDFWQSRIEFQQFAALSEGLFLRSVGQETEVTDAHEAVGQDVEQKATDEFVGVERDDLFLIPLFSIAIAQEDFSVFDLQNPLIGERHAEGVAAEVIEHGLWGTERLFGVDDPAFLA